ncbi:endothelial PAS domain-containing protein 1 [Genypterus blacodes]|uniref:endothelial PAS domain-containing protein 1 n=1 Tax=Genypterus blacodes TaxID=154954 RepID=UPI003F75B2B0
MTADREKRRAVSREAARRRRRVESEVFGDLSRLLPLHPSVQTHLDKPSVIRLTLSYIRIHTLLKGNVSSEARHTVKYTPMVANAGGLQHLATSEKDEGQEGEEEEEEKEEEMYLRTLESFLMVVSADGAMIFLSDNVSNYMGLTQAELMGQNVYDYTHPCDHEEIKNSLRLSADEGSWGAKREFIMRMRSAATHRGRSVNIKSAMWKVLHCQGRIKVCYSPSASSCLLLNCQPLPLSHTLLSTHTFTSQHSMDMRFTRCDQRVTLLLGYSPDELLGRSIYDLCHTLDTNCLSKSHINLCLKSQSVSGQYRMLVRGGGYVWVESHSAVIPSVRRPKSNTGAQQPLCILCVTYVLSGVEKPSLQLSLDQVLHQAEIC